MKEHLVFTIGDKYLAISIEYLQEIAGHVQITDVPGLELPLKGIINLRGRVMPIFSMAELLKIPSSNNKEKKQKIIIFTYRDKSFAGEVEDVDSVVAIEKEQLNHAEGAVSETPFIQGFYKTPEGRIIQVINMERVLEEITNHLENNPSYQERPTFIPDIRGLEITKKLYKLHAKEEVIQKILEGIERYLNAISSGRVQETEEIILDIKKAAEKEVLEEVNKLINNLHNTFNEFKNNIDTRFRRVAEVVFTGSASELEDVLRQTEEASSKTISIVEKQLSAQSEMVRCMDIISEKASSIKDPSMDEALSSLRRLIEDLNMDLMEALVVQQFQDLTGQILKKTVTALRKVETGLQDLINTFGLKVKQNPENSVSSGKIKDQSEVDELLNQYSV